MGIGPGHCFRHFWLNGGLVRLREEFACHELATAGRAWDAGIELANWLATQKSNALHLGTEGSARPLLRDLADARFLELGCGCGLPGLTAAASLGGRVVLTDRSIVSNLVQANFEANRTRIEAAGGEVRFAELDWQETEHRQRILHDMNGGQPFDVLLLADLLYTTASFRFLRDTVLALCAVGGLVIIAQKYRGERWETLGDDGQPRPDVLASTLRVAKRQRSAVEAGDAAEPAEDTQQAAVDGIVPIIDGADGEERHELEFQRLVAPLRRLLTKWFDFRLLQGPRASLTSVLLLELRRVR